MKLTKENIDKSSLTLPQTKRQLKSILILGQLKEIIENEYNLNIPAMFDTF